MSDDEQTIHQLEDLTRRVMRELLEQDPSLTSDDLAQRARQRVGEIIAAVDAVPHSN